MSINENNNVASNSNTDLEPVATLRSGFSNSIEQTKGLSIDDCKYLLFYGCNKEKTIDLGVNDNGQLDYAITQMFLMLQESTRFDAKRVERVFWDRIKALANHNQESHMKWVRASKRLPDLNKEYIYRYADKVLKGTGRLIQNHLHNKLNVEWLEEIPQLMNNEQEQERSVATTPNSSNVADNQKEA